MQSCATLRLRRRSWFDDFSVGPSAARKIESGRPDELRFNRDPFDALIVAAARALELPLVTRDADIIEARVVKAIW